MPLGLHPVPPKMAAVVSGRKWPWVNTNATKEFPRRVGHEFQCSVFVETLRQWC